MDNNVPVCESQMLFSPNRKLDLRNNMMLSDYVHCTDPNDFTHSPFNYNIRTSVI